MMYIKAHLSNIVLSNIEQPFIKCAHEIEGINFATCYENLILMEPHFLTLDID